MKTLLTPRLLGYLIRKKYQYFLLTTTRIDQSDATIGIMLKPVKKHPLLPKLPKPFDRYCGITEDLLQLSKGKMGTQVTVKLAISEMKKSSVNH
jgi:hypothetical protein